MAVLDTTVLVDLLRKPQSADHVQAAAKVRSLIRAGQTLATTRLNVAELFVGVELADHRDDQKRRVEQLLSRFVILELDEVAARRVGTLSAHLRKKGAPSSDMDVLIAAVALVNGQMIVTRNVRHFAEISGISVETSLISFRQQFSCGERLFTEQIPNIWFRALERLKMRQFSGSVRATRLNSKRMRHSARQAARQAEGCLAVWRARQDDKFRSMKCLSM